MEERENHPLEWSKVGKLEVRRSLLGRLELRGLVELEEYCDENRNEYRHL